MDSYQVYQERKLDSQKMWILFLLLGWSYGSMEAMGKQILFYITIGGLGFWTLYRLFTLNGAIKKFNKAKAHQAGMTAEEMMKIGLI